MKVLVSVHLLALTISACKPALVKSPKPVIQNSDGTGRPAPPKEENLWKKYSKYSLSDLTAEGIHIEKIDVNQQPVALVKAPFMDIDFLKIKICYSSTGECEYLKTNQPHTFLTSLKPGKWDITARSCIHKERSETGEQLCSEASEAVAYTQPPDSGTEFSALLQEMAYVNKSYMELGYLLHKELKEFEESAEKCPDRDQEFLAKVRSFTLGGPDVTHNELRNIPAKKLEPGLLLTEESRPDHEKELTQLQKEAENAENRIKELASTILSSKGFSTQKSLTESLRKESETEVNINSFKQLFKAEADHLSTNLLKKVAEKAKIKAGLHPTREQYLQNAIKTAEQFPALMEKSGLPDPGVSAEIATFLESLNEAKKDLVIENWKKYGGYFELSWQDSRENILKKKFQDATAALDTFYKDHQNFSSLSNYLKLRTESRGKIEIINNQIEMAKNSLAPLYSEILTGADGQQTINPSKAEELTMTLINQNMDPYSRVVHFRALKMDMPGLPVLVNEPFRNRFFDLIFRHKLALEFSNSGKPSLTISVINQGETQKTTGKKSTLQFSPPGTPQNINPVSSGLKEHMKEPFKTLTAENFSTAFWLPESGSDKGGNFSPSLIIQTQGAEDIRSFFDRAFEDMEFFSETAPAPENIAYDKEVLSKTTDWRGPALILGLGSLIVTSSSGLKPPGNSQLNANDVRSPQEAGTGECYQKFFSFVSSTINTVVSQALELRKRERANHALWLEKQRSAKPH